jgi:hypothetical protein
MSTTPEANTPAPADRDVPALIRAAGDAAVRAYREFLDDPTKTPSTRKGYTASVRRFFRWAESNGLSLEAIGHHDLDVYAFATAAPEPSLSPVRRVLRAIQNAVRDARTARHADPAPATHPTPPMPQTPEEWQAAVDAADAALMLDSLMQYGLIEADANLAVHAGRCLEILDLGRSLGYTPSRDDGAAAHG